MFLLYCGEWHTASEALRYYAFARTQNQKGVTIASQIRWVHYWEKYLSLSRDGVGLPKLEAIALRKMVFSRKAPAFEYFVAGCHGEFVSSKDKDVKIKETKLKDGGFEIEILPGTPHWVFLKDFQFEFYRGKMFGGKQRVMSFWLHTQFLALEPNYYLKMERMDIDKVSKDKSQADFTLELFFEPVSTGVKAAEADQLQAPNDLLAANPLLSSHLTAILQSCPAEQAETIAASLTMMMEGRKMARFYPGDKKHGEKDVEKRDVFVVLKDETPMSAGPAEPRSYTLYWCLDSQSLAGASPSSMVFESVRIGDIGSLLIGKQADIWSKSSQARQAIEDRCISIVAREGPAIPKVELHVEAYSERQLALWIEGIKFLLEHTTGGGSLREEEGELFQDRQLMGQAPFSSPKSTGSGSLSTNTPQNLTPLMLAQPAPSPSPAAASASAPAAAAPSSSSSSSSTSSSSSSAASAAALAASPSNAAAAAFAAAAAAAAAAEEAAYLLNRNRAESFARPPPIRVPQNRHRRVISVHKQKV